MSLRLEASVAAILDATSGAGAFPNGLRPLSPGMRIAGPAFPVSLAPFDNLWLHRAIYAAVSGDILVAAGAGADARGCWGEIMTAAARARGAAGLILDGCIRDVTRLRRARWPIFARGVCAIPAAKDQAGSGTLHRPIMLGDLQVSPGDLIVADDDGIVCVPAARAADVMHAARRKEQADRKILRAVGRGQRTLDLLGLDG